MFKNIYKNDASKRIQHEAVRKTVGWYYYTHELLEVTGQDATTFLDRMYANPIANLKIGSARYTTMLNDKGAIIDDVVIFRMEENRYWVSTLYIKKLIAWLDAHKDDCKVEYKDITDITDMFAVQGPKSKDLLNAILESNIDEQKFFTIRDNKIDGIPVKISRAGFTGEKLGYEIYVSPEKTRDIEKKLMESGKDFGAEQVTEFQIMVLTLPTEKGFYLMCDIGGANPFEVGLDRGIDWTRDFVGKKALEAIKEEGHQRHLLGFIIEDENAHIETKDRGGPGAPIIANEEEVGRVTKYTYGYTVGKNIGYALVDRSKAKVGDKVLIDGYEAILTDKVFV